MSQMTKAEALLRLLSDGKPHHMRELQAVGGWRYGGRIHELRKQGHVIETITIRHPNEFAYQLVKEGQQALAM